MVTRSPAFRNVRANSGITFRPDANTVLWLPGQDDPQSSTIRDRSGKGNDGTLANTTWVQNSKGLWVLGFNGTTSVATVSDAASIQNIFDGGGAVEFWMNPRSDGQNNAAQMLTKLWFVYVSSEVAGSMLIRLAYPFSDTAGDWRSTATVVPINTYTHILISYNADDVANNPIFCVNGATSASQEQATPIGTRTTDIATNLIIGNRAAGARTHDGSLALVRAYDAIQSVTTAAIHYRQERGLFGV